MKRILSKSKEGVVYTISVICIVGGLILYGPTCIQADAIVMIVSFVTALLAAYGLVRLAKPRLQQRQKKH